MSNCLLCGSLLHTFMSFGKMPVANGFLLPKQFEKEYYFNLGVAFCHCYQMVQLTELVERERMFQIMLIFHQLPPIWSTILASWRKMLLIDT